MSKMTLAEAQAFCLERGIPFYSYRLPGEDVYYFGAQQEGEVKHFDRLEGGEKGFIVVPFATMPKVPSLFIRGDFTFQGHSPVWEWEGVKEKSFFRPEQKYDRLQDVGWEEYQQQVTAMITRLQQKKVRKLVLSRTLTRNCSGYTQAPLWFGKLAEHYPEAFVFLFSVPGVATWMGATPEIFLRQSVQGCETMALAGTRAWGDTGAWGAKEREEQAIVSKYVADVLHTNTGEKWEKTGPFSHRAGNVEHLCTAFRHRDMLNTPCVDRLRRALHPTPAVGGIPLQDALATIRQIEGNNRRYYAGYLGPVWENGTFDWFVNLRSMELLQEKVRLYVGGGITALSVPRNEWEETELKSRTLLDIIEKIDYGKVNLG